MLLLVLGEWWAALGGMEKLFWGISIIFSVLFFIQFILSLIGLDFDTDVDADVGGVDMEGGLDADFTVFSMRSVIAFFTFFGWTGVSVLNGGGSSALAIGAGAVVGILAMGIVAYMMYAFSKLSDEGSIFNIYESIDSVGTVYLKIPANSEGRGKVELNLNGVIREVDAMTQEGLPLPTGSSVRVIDIIDDKMILVEPADKYLKSGH